VHNVNKIGKPDGDKACKGDEALDIETGLNACRARGPASVAAPATISSATVASAPSIAAVVVVTAAAAVVVAVVAISAVAPTAVPAPATVARAAVQANCRVAIAARVTAFGLATFAAGEHGPPHDQHQNQQGDQGFKENKPHESSFSDRFGSPHCRNAGQLHHAAARADGAA